MEDKENEDPRSELHVMSYNIQSLGKPRNNFSNLEAFRTYMSSQSHQPDIICLQETFLDSQQSDESVAIKHYKVFRCDDNSQRAGVITYVRNDVKSELILSDSNLQLLIVQTKIGNRTVDVSNCYRRQGTKYIAPPEVPQLTPKQYFDKYIEQHQQYTIAEQRLLIGDFNVETAAMGMPQYMKNMCMRLNVTPTLKAATTRKSTRCIDNQFCCPELITLVKSDLIFDPWEKPSSPHALIHNKFYYPPSDGDPSPSSSTTHLHSTSTFYTTRESSFSSESLASSSTTASNRHTTANRTFKNLSNDHSFLHDSFPSHNELKCGQMMMETVVPVPIRLVENSMLHSRLHLEPSAMASLTESNTSNKGLRKYLTPLIEQTPPTEIESEQKRLHLDVIPVSSNVPHHKEREDESFHFENVQPKMRPSLLIQPKDISLGAIVKDAIPREPHTKPKPFQHQADHRPLPKNTRTSVPKTETPKARTHENQKSPAPVIHCTGLQTRQKLHLSTTIHTSKPVSNALVSTHASTQRVVPSEWTTKSSKLGGRIQTLTKHQRVDVKGPTDKFMHERRVRVHENPLYKKKTFVQEGKNDLDPSQNYKKAVSKYTAGRSIKAAKKAGVIAAVDTAIYAALATDKGRPSLEEAAKTVAIATGTGFVNSAVPGGRLLTTAGKAIVNGNYENLPLDLLLAAPSLIPGNPLHFEREQTQANAPLLGSDLRSDNVNRISADVSVPFLSDVASVGLCYDREQIEFCRDGVNTVRDATAINAHACLGTVLDASLGFSSGTETSEAVTHTTTDGMSRTTQWDKQFSGHIGGRIRVADRKAAFDIGPAFNQVTTTTTTASKTDGTPLSIRENLSLKHLKKVKDDLQIDFGATPHIHQNYVHHESEAFPTDGRVERVYDEKTIVQESWQAYGLWTTDHKTEKYDVYEAEENALHRSDREVQNELETTLTHQHAELSGRDLREISEKTTKLVFFSSKTNEKYVAEEKRDKEVVQLEWTDKTRITSKKDGTAYDVQQSETTAGTTKIKEIEKDHYKTTRHLGTSNEIASTIGERETTSTNRSVKGILQPEVTTISREVQQVFVRTKEHTELKDPHFEKVTDVKQTYGLLTNKTEVSVKTLKGGGDKDEEQPRVVETLGGAAHGALSSVTSNVLHLACNPASRTKRNVCNAVVDVVAAGAVGWAHSNVAARQNTPSSAAVAAIVTVAAHSVTKMTFSNSETPSTKELLTDVVLSSASSIVSGAANVTSKIPAPLRTHAGVITSLTVRSGQIIHDYQERRMNREEAAAAILQEVTFAVTNYGIQAYLVPQLVALLPLAPLGASVAICIAGAALTFAASKVILWTMNKWRERRSKKEYQKLCKRLDVSSTATDAAVDSRYRRLALRVHPDKTGGDGTRFRKLTKDFERLHQLRLRYNIQPDRTETKKIIKRLKEFLKDPMSFFRDSSRTTTTSTTAAEPESPLMLTHST